METIMKKIVIKIRDNSISFLNISTIKGSKELLSFPAKFPNVDEKTFIIAIPAQAKQTTKRARKNLAIKIAKIGVFLKRGKSKIKTTSIAGIVAAGAIILRNISCLKNNFLS